MSQIDLSPRKVDLGRRILRRHRSARWLEFHGFENVQRLTLTKNHEQFFDLLIPSFLSYRVRVRVATMTRSSDDSCLIVSGLLLTSKAVLEHSRQIFSVISKYDVNRVFAIELNFSTLSFRITRDRLSHDFTQLPF